MELRRRNLKKLASGYPSQAQAARAMSLDPPALSRLLNGDVNLGSKRARAIEKALKLEDGWLDQYREDMRAEWIQACCAAVAAGRDSDVAAATADSMQAHVSERFN